MSSRKLRIVTGFFSHDETSTSYIMGEVANAMARKYVVGVICVKSMTSEKNRRKAQVRTSRGHRGMSGF